MEYRVGIGYDLHRTQVGRPLVLGNITIEHPFGLIGHSDADVVIHALIDAITGAAGLPDVGQLFPNSDPQYHGIDSGRLLEHTIMELQKTRWSINNVDVVIIAQSPKISPHKPAMQRRLAELLRISADLVNIKGKTNETVDAVGHEQAIACHCVALLKRDV